MKKIINIIGKKSSIFIFVLFSSLYSIFLFGVFIFVVSPMIEKTSLMKLDNLEKVEMIQKINTRIKVIETEIDSSKNSLNTKMGLFLNDQEIEKFYEEISNLSLQKEMTMRSLVRGNTEEMEQEDNNSNVKQYKVSVSYELEGSFMKYLSLRETLANLEKVIIFESENIKRSKGNNILAIAEISVPKMVFGGDD